MNQRSPRTAVGRTGNVHPASESTGVISRKESVSTNGTPSPHRLAVSSLVDLDNIVLKAMRKENHNGATHPRTVSEDIPPLFSRASCDREAGYLVLSREQVHSENTRAGVAAAAFRDYRSVGGAVTPLWQAHAARQERDKGRTSVSYQVRKLANFSGFELHDSIENLRLFYTFQRAFGRTRALEYLDSLADEAVRYCIKTGTSGGLRQIGRHSRRLRTSHLGQRQKAGESYRKALSIREALSSGRTRQSRFSSETSQQVTSSSETFSG